MVEQYPALYPAGVLLEEALADTGVLLKDLPVVEDGVEMVDRLMRVI
ncbi:MAG: hypothetical protein ABEJ36_02825 [Candidatus Nanosalina sp.]